MVAVSYRGRYPGPFPGIEAGLREPVHPLDKECLAVQTPRRSDDHLVCARAYSHDVYRPACGHLDAAPLADGIELVSFVLAEHGAGFVDDSARTTCLRLHLPNHRVVVAVRDEADVLAVRLVRDGQAKFRCDFSNPVLCYSADGKEQALQVLPPDAEQEIRLVLVLVAAFFQEVLPLCVLDDARVMTRGEVVRAGLARVIGEFSELQVAVTDYAGVRRSTAVVFACEVVDNC